MTERSTKPTSREEDYRDYEERDLDEGWPYADAVNGSDEKVANSSYGSTAENFDESGNPGFETSDETAIRTSSGGDPFGMRTEDEIDDDVLEEAIVDMLENSDVDISGVDMKVSGGIVELSGTVETAAHRRVIENLIYAVAGVTGIRSNLTLGAADGNIPPDWDE